MHKCDDSPHPLTKHSGSSPPLPPPPPPPGPALRICPHVAHALLREVEVKISHNSARNTAIMSSFRVGTRPRNWLAQRRGLWVRQWSRGRCRNSLLIIGGWLMECFHFSGPGVVLGKSSCNISHLFLAVLPYTYFLLICASTASLNPYTYFQLQAHFLTKGELSLLHPTHIPTPWAIIPHSGLSHSDCQSKYMWRAGRKKKISCY